MISQQAREARRCRIVSHLKLSLTHTLTRVTGRRWYRIHKRIFITKGKIPRHHTITAIDAFFTNMRYGN